MRRVLFVAVLGVFGCGDDEGAAGTSGTTGQGSTSEAGGSTSGEGSTTDVDPSTTAAATSSSTSGAPTSTGGSETADGSSSESGSSTGGETAIGFAEIQVDLENMAGAQGAYPSCIDGVPCHNNPDRNVVLVANPTPEQLMQNYQSILDAPGTPWVTPLDDSAQMLNEVSIPDDIRARWLAWIQAGAPFE